jgi:hypothetical protein
MGIGSLALSLGTLEPGDSSCARPAGVPRPPRPVTLGELTIIEAFGLREGTLYAYQALHATERGTPSTHTICRLGHSILYDATPRIVRRFR